MLQRPIEMNYHHYNKHINHLHHYPTIKSPTLAELGAVVPISTLEPIELASVNSTPSAFPLTVPEDI